MTKQEYYDLLVKSASDGTFPSERDGMCKYRLDGTPGCKQRCAAGLLIPDEMFKEEWNTATVEREDVRQVLQIPGDMTLNNVRSVQAIHDGYGHPWNAREFITKLNALSCFADVQKQEVSR